MNFSERQGLARKLQRGSMDDALRNALWNAYDQFRSDVAHGRAAFVWAPSPDDRGAVLDNMFEWIWTRFLSQPLDLLGTRHMPMMNAWDYLRAWYFDAEWNEVYDFVEFISSGVSGEFANLCNEALLRERSAYRLVQGRVIEILDEKERAAIDEALAAAEPFAEVHRHLRTALARLADRPEPDTRNAIDEAVSAVETLVGMIAGAPGATLDEGLKLLQSRKILPLHASLIKAWSSIYGYTSDVIRHGMKQGQARPVVDVANYLVVSCSAFVSCLLALAARSGVPVK